MFSFLYRIQEKCSWSCITHYYGSNDAAKQIFKVSITLLLPQEIALRMPGVKEKLLTFPEHLKLYLIFYGSELLMCLFTLWLLFVLLLFLFVLSMCLSSYWFTIYFLYLLPFIRHFLQLISVKVPITICLVKINSG